MPAEHLILAVNPGAGSTKLGVFAGEEAVVSTAIRHAERELAAFRGRSSFDQLPFRRTAVAAALAESDVALADLDAVVGRGGLLRPLASGTYRVDETMLAELRAGAHGEHASNLGAPLAHALAQPAGAPAFVVDPVTVDELSARARLSGLAGLPRRSRSHALNTKAVAKRFAREQGRAYDELRLVVAHLGSGISVSAHHGGAMVDVNDSQEEGPFSGERAGSVPVLRLVRLCFSGRTEAEIEGLLLEQAGVVSYLGTRDLAAVEERVDAGDEQAALVLDALAYQVAKEIGACAAALGCAPDAILLTGGMAHSQRLVRAIAQAVEWIAPVHVYTGEDELRALAEGALRVLRGEEKARAYGAAAPASSRTRAHPAFPR